MDFLKQRLGSRRATLRLAALLLVITMSIVASKLAEDHFVENLRKDCSSLFFDRLMPATTLFHLSDAIYQKREVLIAHLSDKSGAASKESLYRLGQQDAVIEQHIKTIEETFLVNDETRLLRELRASLKGYAAIEEKLLRRHEKGEATDGRAEIQPAFDELRSELLNLTKVQEAVGLELRRETLESATSVTTLLYFQLGVAFALGLLASALAMGLRPQRPEPTSASARGQMH
jgi:hypothetical protein